MTPAQSRAARAWLAWDQPELARRAEVGISTVKDFERGKRTPMVQNVRAMQRALEAVGVTFVEEESRKGIVVNNALPEGAVRTDAG